MVAGDRSAASASAAGQRSWPVTKAPPCETASVRRYEWAFDRRTHGAAQRRDPWHDGDIRITLAGMHKRLICAILIFSMMAGSASGVDVGTFLSRCKPL